MGSWMGNRMGSRESHESEGFAARYRRLIEPRATGLPNWIVVSWFPIVIGLGAVVLTILGISGTSSGAHWLSFGVGEDPRLLLGRPRPIRSDEWLVSQGWIVSQFQQGFPIFNRTLPGGMDATVLFELPNWDWSTLFRPHLWGYLLFGLDVGTAWQWWLPAFALVSGSYLLVVTLLPRRPMAAALVAAALYFSPMFQWWYGPNALWPAAWALLAMAGILWMVRDPRLWIRLMCSGVLGWLAVTMALGLYIPFMLPSVLVFGFFFIGVVLQEHPWERVSLVRVSRRLLPLAIAGVAAATVTVVWVVTRLGTFDAVQSTVYPGARSDPTGQLAAQDPYFVAIGGAPLGQSFRSAGVQTLLGPNPSEAATAILLAVFLAPALGWFVVRAVRRREGIDWIGLAMLVSMIVALAYLLVPGWDPVARLLLLDRVPVSRFRMIFAVMMPVFFALVAREVARVPERRNRAVGALCSVLALVSCLYVVACVGLIEPATLDVAPLWPLTSLAIVVAVLMVFFPSRITLAALSLLVASMTIGTVVNPLYRGIFNLNDTAIGQEVAEVDRADPGAWVGVGSYETMAVLVSAGVEAYNGVQPYPPTEMWHAIDPGGEQADAWNRLGRVSWAYGDGEPVVGNPYRDAILVTFDACSLFAQEHVDYLLADQLPPSKDCLIEVADVEQGPSDMQVYRIVPGS